MAIQYDNYNQNRDASMPISQLQPLVIGGQQPQYENGAQKPIQQRKDENKEMSLKNDLALIQALNSSTQGSDGLGQTIGSLGGTAVGAAFGNPMAGQAVGSTVGSVVDYMIDKDAKDKAEQKRIDALRKAKLNEAKKQNYESWLESIANKRSIMQNLYSDRMTKYDVSREMRQRFLTDVFTKIADGKKREQAKNDSYLQSRRVM